MNSQSPNGLAKTWKASWNGPSMPLMNPWAGVPPLIQARDDGVAKPKPKSLSTNAQRKVKPMTTRATARTLRASGRVTIDVLGLGLGPMLAMNTWWWT